MRRTHSIDERGSRLVIRRSRHGTSGMSLDQPRVARKPLTKYEKYGHVWSR